MMVETGSLESLRVLANAAAIIAEGEVLQLTVQQDTSTTEDAYLQIIIAKTAALFAAAAEVGPIIAGRPREEQAALESYGRNLGIAFQLVDDALDYSGKQACLARPSAMTFAKARSLCPWCSPTAAATRASGAFWKRTLEDGEQGPDDLQMAQRLMERHIAIGDTIERGPSLWRHRARCLGDFPPPARTSGPGSGGPVLHQASALIGRSAEHGRLRPTSRAPEGLRC
jgi:octaprenyl-diphosphate synthase